MKYRLVTLFLVFGSQFAAPGQTCNNVCNSQCGPAADVGKQRFQECMGSCVAKCESCAPITGTLFPKYYVGGLVYAPPGCTNTQTQKCATQGTVDYQAGSSLGTNVSTQSSFQASVDVKVNFGFGDPKATQFGGSASTGFSSTTTDTKTQAVTKSQNQDIKASGNGDGIDHDQDTFILLLNPAVAIQQGRQFSGKFCTPSPGLVSSYVGYSGPSQVLFTLPVAYLKNPGSMPANVAQQLKALNFSNKDFQTILNLDPFANGSTAIDLTRYTPTTTTFPYEPVVQSPNCNGGQCSCIPISNSIKNDLVVGTITSAQSQYKVGFTESLSGIDPGVFSFGATADQNFTWTSTATTANTTDSSQTATVTVGCPSSNYNGPVLMAVYWDNLYGSFLFVPTVLTPQTPILSRGTVTSASGQPVRQQPVTLSFGGKTYHTYTNHLGKYVFVAFTGSAHTGPGEIQVANVHQPVTLGSAQELAIRIH